MGDKFPQSRSKLFKTRRSLTDEAESARIEEVLPESGPVAQLGARFHGMEEVTGSIPVRSTKQPSTISGLAPAFALIGAFQKVRPTPNHHLR